MFRAVTALLATITGVTLLVLYRPTPEDLAPGAPAPTAAPTSVIGPTPAVSTPRPTAAATAQPTPATRDVAGPLVQTRFGPVQVKVSLDGRRIVDVQALVLPTDRARSAFISQYSGPRLRTEAIQAQSADIDIISGATYTSVAYQRSLSSALSQAGL